MTEAELSDLRALYEKTTHQREWVHNGVGHVWLKEDSELEDIYIASFTPTGHRHWQPGRDEQIANAAFAAAAHKAVPALLAELDAAHGIIADMMLDAGAVLAEAERTAILRRIREEEADCNVNLSIAPADMTAAELMASATCRRLADWIESRGRCFGDPLPVDAARREIDRLRAALRNIIGIAEPVINWREAHGMVAEIAREALGE